MNDENITDGLTLAVVAGSIVFNGYNDKPVLTITRDGEFIYDNPSDAAKALHREWVQLVSQKADDIAKENLELRRIIAELGYCTAAASIEFIRMIPAKVRAERQQQRNR